MRIIPWQDTSQAIAVLASCIIEPPKRVRHFARYYLTTDEWVTYDEADERVAKLADIRNQHFLAAERISMAAAGIAIGLTVDEAIDAARDAAAVPVERAA